MENLDDDDWAENLVIEKPLGLLRIEAHEAFDPIWKRRYIPRQRAYSLLARALDVPERKAHFGNMDREELERAMPIIKKLYKQAKRGRRK